MGTNIVRNIDKLRRGIIFEGLPHIGTCSPTDIDFCIEVQKYRKAMFGELKEEGKELDPGQRLALSHTVNAYANIGYDVVAFFAWHKAEDEIVYVKDAILCSYYRVNKGWRECYDHKWTVFKIYTQLFRDYLKE